MSKTQYNPKIFQSEGTKIIRNQYRKVYKAFYRSPKTMLMVSIETGILRANICRYVARLKKHGNIRLVRKGICPISKHRAGFYIIEPSNNHKQ